MTRAMIRRIFLSLLVTAVIGACLTILCQAQEPASSQPAPNHHPGVGQQLVRETREAAGEDDNAKLKHSSSVRIVSKLTGLDLESAYLLCVALNFAVIAGVIFWFCKKYLPNVFRNRTASIQKAMAEARKASEEANRRLSDIEARLSRLDAEVAEMRASAEKDAAAEEERIKASAEQEIAAAAKSARRELTAYAADLAVALARKQIQVDASTDQALVRSFAQHIAASDGGSKGKE
jgi:F-type H+-transporting ATPase subunit b